MKQLHGGKSTANLFSTAALALAVGLACWSSAVLATNDPIPGVDIIVKKNPGGIPVHTKTDVKGRYFFKNLVAGEYDLCIPEQACRAIAVDSSGKVSGQVLGPNKLGAPARR